MGAVGSAAGFSQGLVQAHAADPTGGNITSFAIGGLAGAVFGAANPYSGLVGLGGSAAGGAIGSALGNTNMGVQIGGFLGDIVGAGVDDVFRAIGKGAGLRDAVKHGAGQVGVTLGVAGAAGGATYLGTGGNLNSALTVANLASIPGNLLAQKIVPCFPAGTLVLTPEGHTAIEDLRAGDLVLSRPEDDLGTLSPTPQVVEEVFTREGQLFELVIAGRVLRTTPEHPFFVEGQGWTPAGELQPGHLLSTATGEWLPVESITNAHQSVTVYNFRVSNFHTYFIAPRDAAFDVWVHNAYKPSQNGAYRALRGEDLEAISEGRRIAPKGTGGSIIDHIQGRDTKYISVSMSHGGTATYRGPHGVADIDLDIAFRTGSGLVPHQQVLQVAKKHGTTQNVKDVIKTHEALLTNGLDPSAIIRILGAE